MMNKRETEIYLAREFEKQMAAPSPMPKELAEKYAFYRVLYGKDYKRKIYKEHPYEFMQYTTHLPYGWLALYDDYTEKDLSFFFRLYKAARIDNLKAQGIRIRKYLTSKSIRDYVWAKMAKKYKKTPKYKR